MISYGGVGRFHIGQALEEIVSVDPFPTILRCREMPELAEGDLVGEALMPEMFVMLIMQCIFMFLQDPGPDSYLGTEKQLFLLIKEVNVRTLSYVHSVL